MTDLPENLNDYNAWIDKGNIKEAMDALKNQVAYIVGNEQTAQMLVAQLTATVERRFDALDKQIAAISAHLTAEDERLDDLEHDQHPPHAREIHE